MVERYWLVHANGGQQQIDPRWFELAIVADLATARGGRLMVETAPPNGALAPSGGRPLTAFEPPLGVLGRLFRSRLDRIFTCAVDFQTDINPRPTHRVLGGYYRTRRLVRVYSHDRQAGRRPLEELFDTYLHEVAHHLEYTEPGRFGDRACGRVPGRMHSPLFWRILGELKGRWSDLQRPA